MSLHEASSVYAKASVYSGVDTSDFFKDILEFHTQDGHSWLITYNKQKERNERE